MMPKWTVVTKVVVEWEQVDFLLASRERQGRRRRWMATGEEPSFHWLISGIGGLTR